ncbi:hypothetical protein ACWT_6936 [Actinoplanes sp. SE50]|uniref:hypothetical protein n=1 Tax=unclassified Actinoplanes TaxID=2626549 RepID=UPI00023EBC62|nr:MULTISPECIES: hypothetical protein [unclassified Actinoplanes]AEV87947.1 uncharacterized protein ACPL_7067 [Actinoplanes sp. SE50/110]ATO86351.1 hypothetical protein ACWT_6936 [Actinoplanes sp. SE50]SLM03766.1 uncharacterized protein ACSP50_7065 [Actinoplanes sp. SE50/110]
MRFRPTDPPAADDAAAWITGAVPDGWFTEPPEVVTDRDEIIIWGRLPEPDLPAEATDADRAAALAGRITQFRENTRDDRIRVARQVEHRYQRKVAWGVRCGSADELWTHLSAPVMTRLRQPERQVLDTLVDAGVARSRSDALAWCVRLVGEHTEEWLAGLRDAMTKVDELRKQGPLS